MKYLPGAATSGFNLPSVVGPWDENPAMKSSEKYFESAVFPKMALKLSVVLILAPTHTPFLFVAGELTVPAPVSPSLPAANKTRIQLSVKNNNEE